MNLFLATRRLTSNYEDHFTAFIAASLEISPEFKAAYATALLGDFAARNGWPKPEIERVNTQVTFPAAKCCVDMVVYLVGGKAIACEHKLEAPETVGADSGERDQLQRYLALERIDGVLYVRASWRPPKEEVLNHAKYIRPAVREHFLWNDLYPMLENESQGLLFWMKRGFQRLGFMPPHPALGDPRNQDDRRNFKQLWEGARAEATSDYGWRVTTGALIELYLHDGPKSLAKAIWISPTDFTTLIFRVTPLPDTHDAIMEGLETAVARMPWPCEITKRRIRRKDGLVEVYDVTAPLKMVLGDGERTVTEMKGRLARFVDGLLWAVLTKQAKFEALDVDSIEGRPHAFDLMLYSDDLKRKG